MPPSFEEVRAEAVERAGTWSLDTGGRDALAEIDPVAASALRVEAFETLLPYGLAAAGLRGDLGSTGLKGLAKRRSWDRLLRSAGLRLIAWRGRRSRERSAPTDVAFLSELATPSTLEPMLAVAGAMDPQRWTAIAADPRALSAWAARGRPPVAAILPLHEEQARLRAARRRAEQAWQVIERTRSPISFAGLDTRHEVLPSLRRLTLMSAPWLAVERAAVSRHLEAIRPRWLVLASDQHRLGRIAVSTAQSMGIRTLVLQHGLPQWQLGFVPVVADEIATWSAASDRWFEAQGTSRHRLVRLGNPRLDVLARLDRDAAAAAVATELSLAGAPRLLLALSPNDESRNLALVDLALTGTALQDQAVLVIKLHPTDGRWDAVRARIREHAVASRVRVARREPLYPLLAWADAVLLHRSTVAVEALAAGTPVVIGVVGAPSVDDALPKDVDLPEVSTPGDLAALARRLANAAERRAFIAARRAAVELVSGPLDGRVAERIAGHLRAGAAPPA